MLFARSYLFMIIGILLLCISVIMTFFAPFFFVLFFMLLGVILVLFSIITIHMRAINTTLINLLEDPKRGRINWLYVYGDSDIVVSPAMRRIEKHSYNKKLDQQIREYKTYSFAGHKIRIVPEGVGHSVDLGSCLYASHAKRFWNVKSLTELRDFWRKKEDPEEKETTIEEYKKIRGECDEC